MINYNKLEIEAALIGNYALYRFTFMRHSMKSCLKRLIDSGRLKEHLVCVQKTTEAYIDSYLNDYRRTVDYDIFNKEECGRFLEQLSAVREAEEERIGNLWICTPNPYNSEEFCQWSLYAGTAEMI